MRLRALVISLVLAASVFAAPDRDARVRDDIRKLVVALQEAVKNDDRAALERIYADEFVFVHSNGIVEDKASWIATLLSQGMRDDGSPVPFDQLQVYGDTAVLRQRVPQRMGITLYAKKDGRWQIIQVQSTNLLVVQNAVVVDDKILQSYVGLYVRGSGQARVWRDGRSMFVQIAGRPKMAMGATSNTQFVLASGPHITFHRDDSGNVTHFVQHVNGSEIKWTRKAE